MYCLSTRTRRISSYRDCLRRAVRVVRTLFALVVRTFNFQIRVACCVHDLLKSLYKSLYKNAKDPTLSIFRSPWRPEKSCVFAATVLDPSDTQRQTRTGRPFSCLYRTRPAAFCPYPGGLNFGQIGSASLAVYLLVGMSEKSKRVLEK